MSTIKDNLSQNVHLHAAEVQRRAARVLGESRDAVIQAQTGSGKTLAFVLPLLARLDYPPALFPQAGICCLGFAMVNFIDDDQPCRISHLQSCSCGA